MVNVPAQNTDSVVEHAFALYSAVKRHIVPLHHYTLDGVKWPTNRVSMAEFKREYPECVLFELVLTSTRPTKDEQGGDSRSRRLRGSRKSAGRHYTCHGVLTKDKGKCAEKMATALGMKVLIAERKGATEARSGRLVFEDVIKESTVVILTCPLDESTHNMIDEAELRSMRADAILVNVGRGGIVNEQALATALKEARLAGAATDVFETEPATKENCPLLDPSIPNLVLTPHIAWFSSGTIKGTLEVTVKNLECFSAGKPQNVIYGPSK